MTLFFTGFACLSLAQHDYQHFIHINAQNGLANNLVRDIAQDKKGYIWIATDGGLQQFDGNNYTTYTTKNSGIPSNRILKVFIAADNTVWVISTNGVCLLNRSTNEFSRIRINSTAEQTVVPMQFFEDEKANLYLITTGGGLFLFDSGHQIFILRYDTKESIEYCGYLRRGNNSHWFATSNAFYFSDDHFQSFQKLDPDSLLRRKIFPDATTNISAAHLDKEGNLWFSFTTQGKASTYIYQPTSGGISLAGSADSHPANFFLTTKAGVNWQVNNTLYRRTGDQWKKPEIFGDLPYDLEAVTDSIYCISEDRDGTLWLGTDNGMFVFLPQDRSFNYLPVRSIDAGVSDQTLKKLFQMNDSTLGIMLTNGTILFVDRKFDGVLRRMTTQDTEYFSVVSDDNGLALLSGQTSLSFLDSRASATIRTNYEVCAIAGTWEEMWMATSSGMLMHTGKAGAAPQMVVDLKRTKDFLQAPVISIIPEKDTEWLWVSTTKQVMKVSTMTGTVEVYAFSSPVHIVQVANPGTGQLLVATTDGLYFFDRQENNFHSVVTESGVFQENIIGFVLDRFHNIWVTTAGHGLFRISASLKEVKRYGENDGLVYADFIPKCNLAFNDHIVLGTGHGLLIFTPERMPAPLFNPRVQITSFRVNDNDIPITSGEDVDLKWNENTVSIDFSSMSFIYRDKVEYSYRLEGQDDQWVHALGGERIRYGNLRPGRYTFRVRCMALSANRISDEASIDFTIEMPFWQSWEFKVVLMTVIIALVIFIYWWREQRRRRIQEIKNKISRDLHDHIGSSLSSINIMLNVTQSYLNTSPEKAQGLLTKIANNAHITQENLHDIVWSINAGNNSMRYICERMREFMTSLFEGSQVIITLTISEEVENSKLPLEKRYELYLLFKEIVNNGAKHAYAGNVNVRLSVVGNDIVLRYEDDGIGFDMNEESSGNGLRNMRTRAGALNGEIEIHSSLKRGTNINVTFPVN